MGRAPCCDKANVKKGPWSPEEDAKLKEYVEKYGTGGNWIAFPQKAGLKRCGKSCRLRWLNYLRPNIKHGEFSDEEDRIICSLYASIGSRWSIIAGQLPGRTDNDIKNYWNTKLKKKLMGITNNKRSSSSSSSISSSSISSSSPSSFSYGHHQQYPIFHHHPSSSSLSSSSPPYNQCTSTTFYNSSPSSNTINMSFTMQDYQPQGKDNNTLLMFGSGGIISDQQAAPSCSSSDGSNNNCNNNNTMRQSYEAGLYQEQQDHGKLSSGSSGNNAGLWGQISQSSVLDNYGLEEIKQLISTTSINVSGINSFNCFDENKDEESNKIMYYY